MNFNVTGDLLDQSVGLGTSGELYRAIAALVHIAPTSLKKTPSISVLRTADPAAAGPLPAFDLRATVDQPFVHAFTHRGPMRLDNDRLYVGYDDRSHKPQTATVDVRLDAQAAAPIFNQVRLASPLSEAEGRVRSARGRPQRRQGLDCIQGLA